jgi:hypothetical protein
MTRKNQYAARDFGDKVELAVLDELLGRRIKAANIAVYFSCGPGSPGHTFYQLPVSHTGALAVRRAAIAFAEEAIAARSRRGEQVKTETLGFELFFPED